MPPPTTSSIEDLAAALAATTPLSGCEVRAHSGGLAKNSRAPRIVLVPLDGTYEAASNFETQIATKKTRIEAHLWGGSEGKTEDLEARLFQALDAQAAGDPEDDEEDAEGGFYEREGFRHPTTPDDSKHGAALIVTFTVDISLLKPAQGVGLVSSTSVTEGDD